MRMSQSQWRKLDVLERVQRGEFTAREAAQLLGLSRRQLQRLSKRFRAEGNRVVVHGNTGRAPAHRLAEAIRAEILDLARGRYAGFNDQHFTEKLCGTEGLKVSRQTVRRILRSAGLSSPRTRRAPRHRMRRDRRSQAGQMILWDGSRHDWLEGRGPMLCLIGAIDDATGELLPGAHFVDQECSIGYLRVLLEIVRAKGVPMSAYMDRHGTLKRNDRNWSHEEQLAGRQEPTQVRRALDELGIQVIYALSPQAKGRVERLWGTLQDRLVSELRLVGASTVDAANYILERYRADHNARFSVKPFDPNAAWRRCSPETRPEEICCFHYFRQVYNNNTVRVEKQIIDIEPQRERKSFAKAVVSVRHLLSGEYRAFHRGQRVGTAQGQVPTDAPREPHSLDAWKRKRTNIRVAAETERTRKRVTDSLAS
jgi:transposase